ncbi:MAG: hypothetical protein FJ386_10805 [Verrucomicrobia bacterium]|nr:hypothetical protein [Verrucomicrobiota bacterium]
MKSSFELAMERLAKQSPVAKLTDSQKRRLAELDAEYKAKIADREIFIRGKLQEAADKGDAEAFEQLQKQLVSDRKSAAAELEERKEQVRNESKPAP